jgi:hypothetical protein
VAPGAVPSGPYDASAVRLVVLTGASGSGTTTIVVDAIGAGWPACVEVLHFDRIGVPSLEAMAAGFGGAERVVDGSDG